MLLPQSIPVPVWELWVLQVPALLARTFSDACARKVGRGGAGAETKNNNHQDEIKMQAKKADSVFTRSTCTKRS